MEQTTIHLKENSIINSEKINSFTNKLNKINNKKFNHAVNLNLNDISPEVKRLKIYDFIQDKNLLILLKDLQLFNTNLNNIFENQLQIIYNYIIKLLYKSEILTNNLPSNIALNIFRKNSNNSGEIKPFKIFQN